MSDNTDNANDAQGQSGADGNVYLNCISFNQDYSCFVCGTTEGIRAYTSSPVCEIKRRILNDKPLRLNSTEQAATPTGVGLVRMLFKTNLFPMVTNAVNDPNSSGSNKVHIWDEAKAQFVAEVRSKYEVKGVAVARDVLATVCLHGVYIYRGDKLTILLQLTTARNEHGLCALAAAGKPWVLACPGQAPGSIRVQVGQDEDESYTFEAHKTPLTAIALNASGTLIASASEYGTVVKVFSRTGDLIHSLRRGVRSATVTSLAFRADDRFLAVASSSSTVHVFRIDAENNIPSGQGREDEEEAVSPQGGLAKTVSGYLMGAVPHYCLEPKSVALFRIPDADADIDVRSSSSTILGPQVGFRGNDAYFLVLHYNGFLYEVAFNEDNDAGGKTQECTLRAATTWIQVRRGFKVIADSAKFATVAGGATEGEEEADAWQLIP